jgi:hypothetical protein
MKSKPAVFAFDSQAPLTFEHDMRPRQPTNELIECSLGQLGAGMNEQ